MFDHLHYVPILRWKRGEKIALRELYPNQKRNITPLIEFIPRNFVYSDSNNNQIDLISTCERFTSDIGSYWGNQPIFVDFHNINGMSVSNIVAQVLRESFNNALNLNLNLIPVTNLDMNISYQNVIKNIVIRHNTKICLRIDYNNILRSDFQTRLNNLLNDLNLSPQEINLIIDYRIIDDAPDIFSNIFSLIPNILSWRTLTFASGAFPQDLSAFPPGQHLIHRHDWIYWLNNMFHGASQRIPAYSDFTIQYPIYFEPPSNNNPSASIRYTHDEYWIIMRGEGLHNEGGPGYSQYPANAQLLMERLEFCGPGFSFGDDYIIGRGNDVNTSQTGNPETWVRAGINHHIAFVVRQLSSLTGP